MRYIVMDNMLMKMEKYTNNLEAVLEVSLPRLGPGDQTLWLMVDSETLPSSSSVTCRI